jgi:hypothetical protein
MCGIHRSGIQDCGKGSKSCLTPCRSQELTCVSYPSNFCLYCTRSPVPKVGVGYMFPLYQRLPGHLGLLWPVDCQAKKEVSILKEAPNFDCYEELMMLLLKEGKEKNVWSLRILQDTSWCFIYLLLVMNELWQYELVVRALSSSLLKVWVTLPGKQPRPEVWLDMKLTLADGEGNRGCQL